MTENQFFDRFRLGVVQAVRLVRVPTETPSMRFRVEATLTNGETESISGTKGRLKLYRPETAFEFLASLGLDAARVDLASCREPALF